MTTRLSLFALLVNAALCAAYATTPDTFLTTTAVLAATLILTLREDRYHG